MPSRISVNCNCPECEQRRALGLCPGCGVYMNDGNVDGNVCHNSECQDSPDFVSNPWSFFDEDDDDSAYCDQCESELDSRGRCMNRYCSANHRDSGNPQLESYSYAPVPVFHGKGPLYMGMELEVEADDRYPAARGIRRALGDLVYLKSDSSINHGFEVVTHPMDHDFVCGVNWERALKALTDGTARVESDNNGLHVHVSREGFLDNGHVFRWMKFFYRNEREVLRLARREAVQWAGFSPWMREQQYRVSKKIQTAESRRTAEGSGRYHAINTVPENTFEVRVFASTLDPIMLRGTLSFVASTVEYTRAMTAQDITKWRAWEWLSYVRWLKHRRRAAFRPAVKMMEALACAS